MLGLLALVAAVGLLGGGAAAAVSRSVATESAPSGTETGPVPAAAGAPPTAGAAEAPPVSSAAAAPASTPPAASSAPPVPRPVTTAPPATSRPVPSPTVERSAAAPCHPTARACVELSAKRAWLIRDGVVVHGPVPITHGQPGWRTPPGTFRVTFKNKHHRSSLFDNAPMPYSVFFNGGIAFHEGSLAEQSHGCIHLSRSAAQVFFGSLEPGDVVQVVR